MTHYTPIHHRAPNGRVHLAPEVFRLDDRKPIYRRRRHTAGHLAIDVLFRFVLPMLVLLLFAACWVGAFWLVVAIGRAIRSLTGGI